MGRLEREFTVARSHNHYKYKDKDMEMFETFRMQYQNPE